MIEFLRMILRILRGSAAMSAVSLGTQAIVLSHYLRRVSDEWLIAITPLGPGRRGAGSVTQSAHIIWASMVVLVGNAIFSPVPAQATSENIQRPLVRSFLDACWIPRFRASLLVIVTGLVYSGAFVLEDQATIGLAIESMVFGFVVYLAGDRVENNGSEGDGERAHVRRAVRRGIAVMIMAGSASQLNTWDPRNAYDWLIVGLEASWATVAIIVLSTRAFWVSVIQRRHLAEYRARTETSIGNVVRAGLFMYGTAAILVLGSTDPTLPRYAAVPLGLALYYAAWVQEVSHVDVRVRV